MKYISIFLMIVLFVSCTKMENIEELKTVKLTKLYTIEGFTEEATRKEMFVTSYGIKADNKNKLYIYNKITGSIKVFDENGDFYSEISGRGMGPEEIEAYIEYYLHRDTVFVVDNNIKVKKFLSNGKYLDTKIRDRDLSLDDIFLPINIKYLNDSTIISKMLQFRREDGELFLRNGLALIDADTNLKKMIYKTKEINYAREGQTSMWFSPLITHSRERIFLSFMSKSEYKINVYDYLGNELEPIIKKYRKQKFSDVELKLARIYHEKNNLDPNIFHSMYDYSPSVLDVEADKYGNLWVLRGYMGYEMVFDIFKDGKLYSEYKFNLRNEDDSRALKEVFFKDRMYIIDHDENLIDVYDYEFE
ncbi:MAG: 6-bladed beta-propeller [Candidatus Delongbacteria bacterium]|nr:6-bladed beta-propeller [Candidatus Delongbacteria bacterium]